MHFWWIFAACLFKENGTKSTKKSTKNPLRKSNTNLNMTNLKEGVSMTEILCRNRLLPFDFSTLKNLSFPERGHALHTSQLNRNMDPTPRAYQGDQGISSKVWRRSEPKESGRGEVESGLTIRHIIIAHTFCFENYFPIKARNTSQNYTHITHKYFSEIIFPCA